MNPNTFRWEQHRVDDIAELSDGLLWAGTRSYPARHLRQNTDDFMPAYFLAEHPGYRMEVRQTWVHFENRWTLSTIWGDATYSSNRMSLMSERAPFVEEPTHVEVGVQAPDYRNERGGELWGNPLAYVSVPDYHRLCDVVMQLPSDVELPEGEWDESVEAFCDFLITAGLDRTFDN